MRARGFEKAVKTQRKAKVAIIGISGSGKTFSALRMATGMGGKIAVVDTEHGRASVYAHKFDFDVLTLDSFHPERFIEALAMAAEAGYDVTIIDSLSHAWIGKDGSLELVDKAAQGSSSRNTFFAWKDVTPLQNKLIDAISMAPMHVICTLRQKQKFAIVESQEGKQVPTKMGMEAVQRDGLEYEFDLVGDLSQGHVLTISKSTFDIIQTGAVYDTPDEALGSALVIESDDATLPPIKVKETPPVSVQPARSSAETNALKKLWTLIRKHKASEQKFREWLKNRYHVASTTALDLKQMKEISEHVEAYQDQSFIINENLPIPDPVVPEGVDTATGEVVDDVALERLPDAVIFVPDEAVDPFTDADDKEKEI